MTKPPPESLESKQRRAKLKSIIFPSGGKYYYGCMAGPTYSRKRKDVMHELGYKWPASRCGLTVVTRALCLAAGIKPSTSNAAEDAIVEWLYADEWPLQPISDPTGALLIGK